MWLSRDFIRDPSRILRRACADLSIRSRPGNAYAVVVELSSRSRGSLSDLGPTLLPHWRTPAQHSFMQM
jgi:hypothetical protein